MKTGGKKIPERSRSVLGRFYCIIYLLSQTSGPAWGPTHPLFTCPLGSFSGVKRVGCQANHSLPFKAEVKNAWIYTSAPPICLRDVDRDNFAYWILSKFCSFVRNKEVFYGVKDERNIVHTAERKNANCLGHSWRRNCLIKQVIEGKIKGEVEVTGRRGRRGKQLLDEL